MGILYPSILFKYNPHNPLENKTLLHLPDSPKSRANYYSGKNLSNKHSTVRNFVGGSTMATYTESILSNGVAVFRCVPTGS